MNTIEFSRPHSPTLVYREVVISGSAVTIFDKSLFMRFMFLSETKTCHRISVINILRLKALRLVHLHLLARLFRSRWNQSSAVSIHIGLFSYWTAYDPAASSMRPFQAYHV